MNSNTLLNTFRFLLFAVLQIVLFNHIHIFGYATPFPYIIFILLYPHNSNRKWLLIFSFLLGLILDIFNNSGGVHASAALCLAYFREYFMRISFGISYEFHMTRITEKISRELITYLFISILFHHFVLYLLEFFSFSFIFEILINTLFSAVITFIFIMILISFFKTKKS